MKNFEKHYRVPGNTDGEEELTPDDNQVVFDISLDKLEVPEDQLAHDDD